MTKNYIIKEMDMVKSTSSDVLAVNEHVSFMRVCEYLEDGLHVGPYEAGGVGHQVAQHAGTLLLVPPHSTVLQLRQDLNSQKGQTQCHYAVGEQACSIPVNPTVFPRKCISRCLPV